MSIIAISKIPFKWSIPHVMKLLDKIINGPFEALNFEVPRGRVGKICYLRLSEKLDPIQVVEKINKTGFGKFGKLPAYLPRHVPDIALASRPKKSQGKGGKKKKAREPMNIGEIFIITHNEIMTELQSKFTGLYNLSRKTDHKLLAEIAQVVFERLKSIAETNTEALEDCFRLSKCYRKLHPHFGDFQFILSTLHKIQDAEGIARGQIVESEFTAVSSHPYSIDNIPYEKIKAACAKYSDRIVKKVSEHIKDFNCTVVETDREEEIARKKVREEFKKLSPYLPLIIKQVINKQFVPQKSPFLRVRVYGEPFIPSKDQMAPFLKRHRAVHVSRSDRMYNLLKFNVPPDQYTSLMTMDGTVIGGMKLIIRSSDIPLYKTSGSLKNEMLGHFGLAPSETVDVAEMDADEDDEENWEENEMIMM